jgi:voltage-gated sodium channel
MPEPIARRCRLIADSQRFQAFIFGVIVLNAVVLGLDTYEGINDEVGGLLLAVNDACLGVFVVELAIRIAAYGRRPQDFFKEGWNVFDFVVITAAFTPGLRQNATLLRLVRLLRVVRLVSVLPELTVFTLEGWNDILYEAQEVHSWSWIFFISFVLLASLLLINILIAIIINAMEEAREEEQREEIERLRTEAEAAGGEYDPHIETARRIAVLRRALEDLEDQLGIETEAARPRPRTVTRRLGR